MTDAGAVDAGEGPWRRPYRPAHRGTVALALFGVGVLLICAWFLTLDARHLLRSDEGRYAEIAREMFETGDWVTIRYNGLKYFEKPPFHLWMTAIAYHAFGVGEWQARWWVAVSGFTGLVMTMLAARRWFGDRIALIAGLVLLSTPTWYIGSHFNSLDMSVSGALTLAMAGMLLAQHPAMSPRAARCWLLVAWAAMAIAVLTKGLIGIALPGLILVVYTAASRDWRVWQRLEIVSGSIVFALICVPWFVLVSYRNPEFAQFFFIHEHWQRYTSSVHQRNAPVWYFIPQLALGFLPWVGTAAGIVKATREDRGGGPFRALHFLAAWAVSIFIFFSASSSKLPGYIMPMFPALAILAAVALERMAVPRWRRQVLVMIVVAGVAVAATPLINRLGSANTPNALYRNYLPWIVAACAIALGGAVFARTLALRYSKLCSIAAVALSVFVALTVGLLGHEALGRASSGVDLVPAVQPLLVEDMPLYSVRMLDHTLPFYLQHRTIMVETPDELEFGTQQEPDKWMPTLASFLAAWSSGRPALALMSHDTYTALSDQHVVMVVVAQDLRRVVVANFSGPSH